MWELCGSATMVICMFAVGYCYAGRHSFSCTDILQQTVDEGENYRRLVFLH